MKRTAKFLDDDSVPELGGTRPDRLADVRPQEIIVPILVPLLEIRCR